MDENYEEYTIEERKGLFKFIHPDLEAHNKSLEWIESERKRIGAEIVDFAANSYAETAQCQIYINGRKSGIKYRLIISYRHLEADLLARRINEVDLTSKNLTHILSAFPRMIEFETHWYDYRNQSWQHICLEPASSENHPSWPGDKIVSLLNCLSEDMTSVLDRNMRTLRRTMIDALIINWFQGNNPSEMNINRICQYVQWLVDLDKTDSELTFASGRDLILKNTKNNWKYWEELQKTTQLTLEDNAFPNLEDFQ